MCSEKCTPIHFDHHYAAQTEFGKPLVDSTFTLALVTGQSVTYVSQNVFANLGWDEIRLPTHLRGRHYLLPVRGAREAGVEEPPRCRDRPGRDQGLQPGRDHDHNLRPHDNGLQKNRAPKVARLTPGELATDTREREESSDK